jgi:hypothetical protein
MIILPAAICNPPAKRSIEETSALRQQGFEMDSLPNSSLTASVIAINVPPIVYGISKQVLPKNVGESRN